MQTLKTTITLSTTKIPVTIYWHKDYTGERKIESIAGEDGEEIDLPPSIIDDLMEIIYSLPPYEDDGPDPDALYEDYCFRKNNERP